MNLIKGWLNYAYSSHIKYLSLYIISNDLHNENNVLFL